MYIKSYLLFLIIIGFLNDIVSTSSPSSSSSSSSFNKYLYDSDNDAVTLIINPNINNNYIPGDFCGNLTFTCNSMSDAISFFETVKIIVNPFSLGNYQTLNLKIQDSISGISENVIQVYQYNLTISPFVNGSKDVIFDGNLHSSINPLVNIITSVENSESKQQSLVTVTGITFRNFMQPVLKVETSTQNSIVVFDNCNFIGFDGSSTNLPLFDIGTYLFNPNGSDPTTFITISNSQILNSLLSPTSELANIVNTYMYLNNLQVKNITNGANIVFQGTASIFSLYQSQFSLISSNHSIFNCIDTSFSAYGSSFTDSRGTFIYYSTASVNQYTISLNQCQFIGNAGLYSGGVIYAVNENQIQESTPCSIDSSLFINNLATSGGGGVIYASNVPFNIVNSSFGMNRVASQYKGGIFYFINNKLKVINSTMSQSNINTIDNKSVDSINQIDVGVVGAGGSGSSNSLDNQNGEVIFFNGSLVQMQYNTFQGGFDNGSIICVNSALLLYSNNDLSLDASEVFCHFCSATFNSKTICSSSPSSSTSDSSSFTTTSHTTGNDNGITDQLLKREGILANDYLKTLIMFSVFYGDPVKSFIKREVSLKGSGYSLKRNYKSLLPPLFKVTNDSVSQQDKYFSNDDEAVKDNYGVVRSYATIDKYIQQDYDGDSCIIDHGVNVIKLLSKIYSDHFELYYTIRIPGTLISTVKVLNLKMLQTFTLVPTGLIA